MRTCPKCGESNGDNNTHCFKCGAFIGAIDTYQKICPKCGLIYSSKASRCERCGRPLSVYSGSVPGTSSSSDGASVMWPYIVAFLLPTIGIILGLIFIAQRRDEGPSVLITSIVASVVWILLFFGISSCVL